MPARRLQPLARDELLDRRGAHAQDAPLAHSLEPAGVNEPAHGFRVDTELIGDLPDREDTFRS